MRRELEKIFALLLIVTMMVSPVMAYASETNSEEKSEDMQIAEDIEKDAEKTAETDTQTVDIEMLDVNSATPLTLHTMHTATGGEEYDLYSFTPESDGMYFYTVSGDDVYEADLYYYDSLYGNIAWNGYSVIYGREYDSYNYIYLPGGTTYYIVVTNSGNYSGYQIAVDGIAKGENAVSTNTVYSLNTVAPDVEGNIWFTFVPEETGDYSFSMGTDYRITLMRPYVDYVTDYYYSTEISNNIYTVTLTGGETYYLSLYPYGNDIFSEDVFLYVSLTGTYPMKTLDFNVPYTVEAGTNAMYTDSTYYDVYAITPEVDGIYWIEVAWPEGADTGDAGIASPSQNGQHEWQISYKNSCMGLNGGTTYYVLIQRYSDDNSGYTITWTGVRSGDNPIELDTQTPVTDTSSWTDEWDDTHYEYKWGMYTYTPSESGLYTFYSDSDEYVTDVYWVNAYDLRPEQYYQGEAGGSITVYLTSGQTYFLEINADGEEDVNVWLTRADGAGMIKYFKKSADKTSAGSGDEITYTMDTQVVVPQYTQLSGPTYAESYRPWTSEDFTVTFHDTLDDGLTPNPDSIKITYYRYGTPIELTNDNYDGNTVYTVSTDPDDNCSFEITVNLTEMYWTQYSEDDWYFGVGYFDQLKDSWFEVTYDAVLDDDVTPGEYDNTAYVSAYCTDDYEWPEEWGSTAEFTEVSQTEVVPIDTYGLVIYKYDSTTWPATEESVKPTWIPSSVVPLAGAEFELYDADNNLLGTLVTDSDGCAYSTSMTLNGETVNITFADRTQLFIKETKAPDGYKLDDDLAEGFTLTIEAQYAESDYWYWETVGNDAAVFDVLIYKYADGIDTGNGGGADMTSVLSRVGADSVKTYDVNYNNPLVGVKFTLSRETDDGTEYVIAYPKTLSGSMFYYTITGWIADITEATTLQTDGTGYLEFENLPAGTYTLTETAALDGYYQLSDSIVFTVDSTGWVTVVSGPAETEEDEYGNWITVANEEITGKFELYKTDTGGNPIEGAKFILGCFGENVRAQYGVTETYASTPDGEYWYYYLKLDYDESSGTYTWNPDYALDSIDEATVMTTDANGNIELDGLWPSSLLDGNYFLIETEAPDGYELIEDPIVFTVNDDGSIEIVVDNESASMNSAGDTMTVVDEKAGFNIRLYKYDKNRYTEAVTSLQNDSNIDAYAVTNCSLYGAEFILSRTGNSVNTEYAVADMNQPNDYDNYNYTITDWTENENEATVFISNGNGYIEFGNLPAGKYTVTETNAPYGYILLSEPVVFTVSDTGGVSIDSGPAVWDDYYGIAIGNENASETVVKTDENGNPLSGAEFILGVYHTPYMEDSIFDLSAESNIETYGETSDGKYQYEYVNAWYDSETGIYWWDHTVGNREDATRLVTDEEGKINLTGLYPTSWWGNGGYFLIETKAPDGYDMLQDPIVFTIDDYGKIEISTDTAQVGVSDDGTTLTVVDYTSGRMPDAGADGILWYLIFGFGTVGIVSCMAVVRRRIHV